MMKNLENFLKLCVNSPRVKLRIEKKKLADTTILSLKIDTTG